MEKVFVGSDAVRAGAVTPYQLRSRFRAVCPGVYAPLSEPLSLRDRTVATWLWSGRHGVIAELAATALHGSSWVDDDVPIAVVSRNTNPPVGIVTRNYRLAAGEVTTVCGLPVTTSARTAYDLGRLLPRSDAIARLDALRRAKPFQAADVLRIAAAHPGARGVRQLRSLLPLVDAGAASPKESELRLLLLDAGLPRPETQIAIVERFRPIAFLDMGWQDYQVAAEYDGDQHRTDRRQFSKDVRRLEMLQSRGWLIVRVLAGDRPDDVVARVRAALLSRGYRDT
ncbi:hypothetical protein LV457_05335 [Mycobacterium sp. MYCO198283]|uniref:hypothetical protein n=1 Tax=Mycobacterium sp. MYCO198283 TaxID=2883505 RepID=UPI001E35EC62|nr:hypothetical protein [Mycobacterium sp. MYCO198283]MCG5431715.1 hypothetical protein [Mycobacterium sp. MYCO198283]